MIGIRRKPDPSKVARAKAPTLKAASVEFFYRIHQQVTGSGITLEQEPVRNRPERQVPSSMAKSGSYLLRVYHPDEEKPTKIGIELPRRTSLIVTELGVVSYVTENDPASKKSLWTPAHDTRFIDKEDIGMYADFQFGRPLLVADTLSVDAPFGYFSDDAQAFMHTMFDDTLRIIRTDQLRGAAGPAG